MQVTEIKVLKSNAGFYIGRECLDDDMSVYIPYDRLSGYYPTKDSANIALNEDNYFRP
jgi:hypothetical protein